MFRLSGVSSCLGQLFRGLIPQALLADLVGGESAVDKEDLTWFKRLGTIQGDDVTVTDHDPFGLCVSHEGRN